MEFLFVFTHSVMLICLLGIIWMSVPEILRKNEIEKPPVIPSLLTKAKSLMKNTIYISRAATALLTILLR